jgi:hypothetical protein
MEPPHINSSFESIPGATQRLCRAFVGAPEELCRRLEALYGDDPNKVNKGTKCRNFVIKKLILF